MKNDRDVALEGSKTLENTLNDGYVFHDPTKGKSGL